MFSETISVISLVIAIASVAYSRATVSAAREANRISTHAERLSIYKALLAFTSAVSARGVALKPDDVWSYYEPALLARFYFSEEHSTEFLNLFDDAIALVGMKEEWEIHKRSGEKKYQEAVRKTHEKHRDIRDRARKLAEDIEPELIVKHA